MLLRAYTREVTRSKNVSFFHVAKIKIDFLCLSKINAGPQKRAGWHSSVPAQVITFSIAQKNSTTITEYGIVTFITGQYYSVSFI